MINIPKVPKPSDPVMIDRVIGVMQDELMNKIGWLDYSFGRAQRLVTLRDGRESYYPGVFIEKKEYLNVLPGQRLGNRTSFIVDDPHTVINFVPHQYNRMKAPASLVLWYNLDKIYNGTKERNTEAIKGQILRVLSELVLPNGAKFSLHRIYERAENIFYGYSLREIDTQFLMQPFGGLRIEGEITYMEECG